MTQGNLMSVIQLFASLDIEVSELTAPKDSASLNSLEIKQCRHIYYYYLFEFAYALSIEPRRNLSKKVMLCLLLYILLSCA